MSWKTVVKRPESIDMPDVQDFKSRLRNGDILYGTLVSLPSAEICELLANIGFDWLFIDAEHGAFRSAMNDTTGDFGQQSTVVERCEILGKVFNILSTFPDFLKNRFSIRFCLCFEKFVKKIA